jgi:hypothetical protein
VRALTLYSRSDLGVSRIWCGVWVGYTKLDGKSGLAAVSKGAGADAFLNLFFGWKQSKGDACILLMIMGEENTVIPHCLHATYAKQMDGLHARWAPFASEKYSSFLAHLFPFAFGTRMDAVKRAEK